MFGSDWATVDSFAKDEGYTRSLALRKIVGEWVEFKRQEFVDTVVTRLEGAGMEEVH